MDTRNIIIVDDHKLIMAGVHTILKQMPRLGDIMPVNNFKDAIDIIKEQSFDLYIIKINKKEKAIGWELLKTIRDLYIDAKIITYTIDDDYYTARRLVKLKVNGIVSIKSSEKDLEKAINLVLENKKYYCPVFKFLGIKSEEPNDENEPPDKNLKLLPIGNPLTKQEAIILRHIIEGLTSKEIAAKLKVTVDTIEFHRKNLFIKLEVDNVAQLVTKAFRQHIVE